ncbi:STM2901 family protein [Paraburkholderia antibiotica]|uniref:Uncharacterized protein n=1 Tax=Paraburkholderia antibiotica TaxID=2728839 RepID=A0A7X9X1I3_9BURK|nr:hypothetical protein [Paraburkholderia antibiotica]NML29715.1 hypothetical protein [Paraburkholderia antibiotica]
MSENRYAYFRHRDLTPAELFFFIALDQTCKELGIDDLVAASAVLLGQNVIPVAGKLGGATAGTSVASLASRKLLPFDVRVRLPTITRVGVQGVRIAFTRNLGAFVGRTIPVIGVVVLAGEAFMIMVHTVQSYNRLVRPEDQVL